MKSNFLILTLCAALTMAHSFISAAEPRLYDQSAPKPAPAIRGEPIVPVNAAPASDETSSARANPPLQSALARARAVAERMQTNGVRTNATGHLIVGFEKLSNFKCDTYYEIEPPLRHPVVKLRDPVPDSIKALDERRIAVTGYMLPLRTGAKGCTDLLLVRDQASCCFGRAPKMNHWIHVAAPEPGLRVATGYPVTILGTLRVGPFSENGSIISLYEMQGDKLELPGYR